MEKDSLLLDALGKLFRGIMTIQPITNSKQLDFNKYVNKSLSFAIIISDLEYKKNNLPDSLKYLIRVS